jgi:hypothetical protein
VLKRQRRVQAANLEHLKKEAKSHLRKLRLSNPAASLADAQFAVTRKYGFAHWQAQIVDPLWILGIVLAGECPAEVGIAFPI